MRFFLVAALSSSFLAQGKSEPRTSYDRIILKFDPECAADGDMTLSDSITHKLRNKRLTRSGPSTTIDPDSFKQLFDREIEAETKVVYGRVNVKARAKATAKAARRVNVDNVPISARLLKQTPADKREDEILGALHLLAAQAVAGDAETAQKLLAAERQGVIDDVAQAIERRNPLGLNTNATRMVLGRAGGQSKEQLLTIPTSLEFLEGIKIIDNPLLGQKLIELAEYLPCLEVAEADEIIEEEPPVTEEDDAEFFARSARGLRGSKEIVKQVDVIDYETLMLRMKEEEAGGLSKPSYAMGKVNQTFYLKYPNDEQIKDAWHVETWWNGQDAGMGLDSGWAYLIYKNKLRTNPELIHQKEVTLDFMDIYDVPGMDTVVGVMDSGCARHPDLVDNFWRNPEMPGCKPGKYEGTQGDVGKIWYNDCVGFDFGMKVPDPTRPELEGLYKHGTGCSGCIAARGGNGKAGVGVCPSCKIMCLKHKDKNGSIKSSVYLAGYDYFLEKGVKISNHSYGSINKLSKSDSLYKGIKAMEKAGHLFVAAGGNNKCNSDPDASDACEPNKSHRSSGYDLDNIISVGASKYTGVKSSFSNWGPKTIDFYAPGSNVITTFSQTTSGPYSGTSFSSPLTAGVAAVIWGQYPHLNYKQVKEILMKSGSPTKNFKNKAVEPRIISLNRALAYAEKYATGEKPTNAPTPVPEDDTDPDDCVELAMGWFDAPPAGRAGRR